MTTKTVIDDGTYDFPVLQGGTERVGRYYRKAQAGANRLETEPTWWPHPYTMSLIDNGRGILRSLVEDSDSCRLSYPGGGSDVILSGTATLVRPWTPQDDLILYGKLADKFDDASFNAPVFVGELGEATEMLAGRLRQLAKVGLAVKRGDLVKAAKLLSVSPPKSRRKDAPKIKDKDKAYLQDNQTSTSGWLELSYGWKPLVRDVFDLADAIAKRDTPRKQRLYARHWIGKEAASIPACGVAVGSGKYSKSITAYIEEILPSLGQRMGLQDPASIVWELTPFSFVADWVIPIGLYLKARSIANRAKGVFVLTTFDFHRVGVRAASCTALYCKQPAEVLIPGWDIRADLTREVFLELPQLPLPPFQNPFGGRGPVDKLISAVSLVREIFGSKSSRSV